MKLARPQSLSAQFALGLSCLGALLAVLGATTLYALASSTEAIRELAERRLARLQDAPSARWRPDGRRAGRRRR